ncbi:hypothetical protein U9M48_013527 [Paspalum notatum var. saurae]|uniref:Uncharacterized protein n=1 Tax=Paspalum notatum var. saurae TaxID=547442 RepID=A0AAQ3T0R9_PASNO
MEKDGCGGWRRRAARGGAGRLGPMPGGLANPWIRRLTSSHGPYCSSKAVIGRKEKKKKKEETARPATPAGPTISPFSSHAHRAQLAGSAQQIARPSRAPPSHPLTGGARRSSPTSCSSLSLCRWTEPPPGRSLLSPLAASLCANGLAPPPFPRAWPARQFPRRRSVAPRPELEFESDSNSSRIPPPP